MRKQFHSIYSIMMETFKEFSDDHATKLSASLAYYTLFSIGPLLLVIITILSFFVKKKEAANQVFDEIGQFVGKDVAEQLHGILRNLGNQNHGTLFGVIGAIVFIFGATGIFTEIQSSINYIWSVKSKPNRSWLKYITDRLLSFVLVIGLGLLMFASLLFNVVFDMLEEKISRVQHLQHLIGAANFLFTKGVNTSILFLLVTLIFAVIFKVLPDAKIHWKDAFIGAAFTGVLFLIGKFLITWYLSMSKSINAYGAAASLIILLSWIYYSAMILYFGAEFTDVYARWHGSGVTVKKTAVFIVKHETQELPAMKTHTEEDIG
jgi:membrane protein